MEGKAFEVAGSLLQPAVCSRTRAGRCNALTGDSHLWDVSAAGPPPFTFSINQHPADARSGPARPSPGHAVAPATEQPEGIWSWAKFSKSLPSHLRGMEKMQLELKINDEWFLTHFDACGFLQRRGRWWRGGGGGGWAYECVTKFLIWGSCEKSCNKHDCNPAWRNTSWIMFHQTAPVTSDASDRRERGEATGCAVLHSSSQGLTLNTLLTLPGSHSWTCPCSSESTTQPSVV